MRVTSQDDYLEASYITGPTHNTLQLQLTSLPVNQTATVAQLAARGSCSHGVLQDAEVVAAVEDGVARANAALGTTYYIIALRYPANDTPKYFLYSLLAYRITVAHHTMHLQACTNPNLQRRFEIVVSHEDDGGDWHIEGRAWQDIAAGDVLFAQSGTEFIPFEVTQVTTYGREVPALGRMLTGTLSLRDILGRGIKPEVWLVR